MWVLKLRELLECLRKRIFHLTVHGLHPTVASNREVAKSWGDHLTVVLLSNREVEIHLPVHGLLNFER